MNKPVEYIAATIWDNTPPELRMQRIGIGTENETISSQNFCMQSDGVQAFIINALKERNYIKL